MAWLEVSGGRPLEGAVTVQGSKNAALPILAGTLLHRGMTVIHNCPQIADVLCMLEILEELGCTVRWEEKTLVVDAAGALGSAVSEEIGERMRSSVIFMGSLLGRNGEATLPYPGGCTIGERPIDLHIQALREMGAVFEDRERVLHAKSEKLCGKKITLRFPSVGATENVILAAVLAKGETVIEGAAREPEIEELCSFLRGKGAKIMGEGTGRIVIDGVKELSDSTFTLGSDRIVAGTYLFGAALTRGRIFLEKAPAAQLQSVLELLSRMGAVSRTSPKGIFLDGRMAFQPVSGIRTEPYPGFPTDLQSPLLAALCLAKGESEIEESIFEARFQVAEQFIRMGADLKVEGNRVRIRGVGSLHGTYVRAKELRGGAALVLAALGAEGITIIQNDGFIERGYEDLARDLRHLNADIRSTAYGG